MSTLLYDDEHAPITSTIGFFECDARAVTDAFYQWQSDIQSTRGVQLHCDEVGGTFLERITKLFPLTSVERRRHLFISTKSN